VTRSSILAALAALALAPAAAICSAGDGSAAGDARVAGPAFESGKAPPPTRPQPEPRRRPFEPVRWRDSRSLGKPFAGRLVRGVQLPSAGRHFFTWDPILNRRPNRGWRRWGNDRLVRIVLRVLAEHRAANPGAPRVGVGDLSRPRGGDFGIRYGPPGHASHQNGLDVDLYYPRRDRLERAPRSVAQVDRALAQDLVDRFVEAGAVYVFVGPSVGLTGPPKVVQQLAHHDNHLHVRIPPDR
jgi:murein endopeptidase